jgi:hypothetical protein
MLLGQAETLGRAEGAVVVHKGIMANPACLTRGA